MIRYVIDSSSLNELEVRYPNRIGVFKPIYTKISEMFESGELFSVREVFEELRDSQEYWSDFEECFKELTEKESENMADILYSKDFEVFVKWGMEENDGNWADPQLIACAMEDSNITVVTEEKSRNNPQRKIPYVCEVKGIRCIDILGFLEEINIVL